MAEQRFENREMQQRYDESRKSSKREDGEDHKPAEEEADGEPDMADVVEEHGPAKHVMIHSHHEDGHVHKSKHHDAESAHEHIAKAFDEEDGDRKRDEDGDFDNDAEMAHQAPTAIPGMQ